MDNNTVSRYAPFLLRNNVKINKFYSKFSNFQAYMMSCVFIP